ncbi:MAG: CopG family transcriptional regulator [Gammaproteobacteria bacterium]|jgi:plasmid stability protein|uniref:CopG family transcriptional regulator n=1 Tax=Nevskia sp. TaxID=1929292 RepID=UPI00403744C7|nr:CopG family transcriptional regulator [Gammaproteobacteria bacterium]
MESQPIRATIYLDPSIHQALRLKAATTRRPMSEIVSDALRQALREDHDDLRAFSERGSETTLSYDDLLKTLVANGDL